VVTTTPVGQGKKSGQHLRWRAGVAAFVLAVGVAKVSHFPVWATVALALFAAGLSLWPLPPFARRIWVILAASFFFAQCTTIFINQPFTWPMRFGFCAALVGGLTVLRVKGNE